MTWLKLLEKDGSKDFFRELIKTIPDGEKAQIRFEEDGSLCGPKEKHRLLLKNFSYP